MSLIPRPTRRQLLIGGTALSGAAAVAGWHRRTGYGNLQQADTRWSSAMLKG